MPDCSTLPASRIIRCSGCEGLSIQLPEWPHDDAEVVCPGCGENLGTVGELRALLTAALADEPNVLSDNDN